MAVVAAFSTLTGTTHAGMTAYYRAPDCDSLCIADVIPLLAKIDYYEEEYIIGEMLIWDTGSHSIEPNNCCMVRVIVYNDGWICAWFDKTTQNQIALGGAQCWSTYYLFGWGATLQYEDRWNSCQLKITGTDDPNMPVGTIFTIRDTDHVNGVIRIHEEHVSGYHFASGYTYDTEIYMSNGNIMWWGTNPTYGQTAPPENSNRLYRAIYEIWQGVKHSSNSSNYTFSNCSYAGIYDLGTDTFTNDATHFNDTGTNDCPLLPDDEEIDDAFYIALSQPTKFNGVSLNIGTAGVGSGITWEYWNGTAWVTLTCTDNTSGFTVAGTNELTFDPPDDWVPSFIFGTQYITYSIRARVTNASYTTTPILTQGQLYYQNSIGYLETELGVWDFEFTSANYVLLCGDYKYYNVCRYFYYTVLPTKIIYSVDLNIGQCIQVPPYYERTYINGVYVHRCPSRGDNGYLNFNLTDIDYSPGIQNCCAIFEDSTSYGYGRMAVVLLVS